MCHIKCNYCFAVILLCASICSDILCYNVDTVNYIKHKGQPSSMFGFSVASHKERGQSWVLVGAPEAQTTLSRVEKGGSVFKCGITDDDYCQEIPFDRRDDNTDSQGVQIDSKANQWFGATLNSPLGEDTPIVACAPRYVWFANKRDRKDPVGTCYVARDGSYSEYSPCRTNLFGYHRQGSCQAGFSAAISKDGKNLFVGAPGSWYWQGQLYSIDAHATFPYSPGKFGGGPYGTGQVIQQSLETRPSVFATAEGPPVDDDSYMGYSLVVGQFLGPNQQESVAVGMPRSTSLEGKVLVWTWNLTLHSNFTGQQLGSYFGYALAACDVNGDGWDDIIVGAPMHTQLNNEGKYEVGRVHVLFTGGQGMRMRITLDGYQSKSRFGLAVASLGDINLDGFGDFAVGAPYDGPNERGAVYIFHGFADGVREKHAQAIYAEEMTQQGGLISTFGFSIAGNGMDLDNNRYPDMVVGAYLADTAFFFRSRPVVKMNVTVTFRTDTKDIILDKKDCTLRSQESVPCITIDVCFQYDGVGVPASIDFEVQMILDARKKKNPRMFFSSQEGRNSINETIKLQKGLRYCAHPRTVYIKNDIRDKLTQLEAEVRYSMRGEGSQYYQQRNPRAGLSPVLDLSSPPVKKDVISIKKNCGSDNICIPNLKLHAQSNVERYLLGSNEKLEIDVIVQNDGEDSFESTFNLQIPPGMDFIRISDNNNTEVRVLCSSAPNNSIECDIGNPLPARQIAKFRVQLNPYHKEGMNPTYDFLMSVNSTNPEDSRTMFDNTKAMSIQIWVDSKLELQGASKPAEIHYNTTQYVSEKIEKESDIGPQVIHVYTLRNNGPSGINEAEMSFIWPFKTESGEDLFYLLEQPAILGNAKCEPVDANYRNYELEFRKKTIWESIGIDVSKSDFTIASSQIAGDISSSSSGTGAASSSSSGSSFSSSSSSSSSRNSSSYDKTNDNFDSGDGSFVHEQRGKQHGSSQTGYSGQGGSSYGYGSQGGGSSGSSYSSQSGSSSSGSQGYGSQGGSGYSSSGSSYGRQDGGGAHTSQSQGGAAYDGAAAGRQGGTAGTYNSDWNKTTTYNGPITTHTYTKNYTVYGDSDGSSSSSNAAQVGASSSSSSSSSGSRTSSGRGGSSFSGNSGSIISSGSSGSSSSGSSGSTSTGSVGRHRPNIIYSSSGSQQGQDESRLSSGSTTDGEMSFGPQLGGSASGTGRSEHRGYQWNASNTEENMSGQNLRGVPGGTIINVSGDRTPGRKQTFDWESRNGQSGGDGGQGSSYDSRTNYNQQQGGSSYGSGSRTTYQGGPSSSGQSGQSGQNVDQRYYQQSGGQRVDQRYNQQSGGQNVDQRYNQQGETQARGEDHRTQASSEHHSSRPHYTDDLYENAYSSEEYTGENMLTEGRQQGGAAGQAAGSTSGGAGQAAGSTSGGSAWQHSSQGGSSSQQEQRQQSGRNRSTYGQYDRSYEEDVAKHGLGAAALGHGFHTTSLDLGVMGGNRNADESVSAAAAAGRSSSGQQEYSGAGGAGAGAGAAGQHYSGSSSWQRQYGSGSEQQQAAWNAERARQQQQQHASGGGGGSRSWSSHSETQWSSHVSSTLAPEYIGRDNVPTDKPDMRQFVGKRRRRQAYDDEIDITNLMHCKATQCMQVRCTVGPLRNGEDAIIALRSRLNIRTLKAISISQPVSLSTMMLARISKLPYIGRPLDPPTYSHEIFTVVEAPEPDIKPDIVPLWVVVLSAVAGTLILLLLIFLLYKCGFFKRHRPSESAERQPLNRNGHYQNGDEAL